MEFILEFPRVGLVLLSFEGKRGKPESGSKISVSGPLFSRRNIHVEDSQRNALFQKVDKTNLVN